MSRELLKRAEKQLILWANFYGKHYNTSAMENVPPIAGDINLLKDIETELAKPDPEPVAWGTTDAIGNLVDVITEAERDKEVTNWHSDYTVPRYRGINMISIGNKELARKRL